MPLPTPSRAQICAMLLLAAMVAHGEPVTNDVFAARAQAAFNQAQQYWTGHPGQVEAACRLGRASYDWAEFATNSEQRAKVSQAGITACRLMVMQDPKSARAHYYLAMDYGELAEAEAPSLAAYKLIWEIEREFKTAAELDERLDYAGPARCLGLLYRDAPGWPISIGSRHKALEFLDRAAALAPDYPENQLNLLESHVRWRQSGEADKAWQKLAALWPAARTNLTGVAWEASWNDWTKRRGAVKADYQKVFRRALEP